MSLGLQVRGALPTGLSGETTLQTIESWFRDECGPVLRDIGVGEEGGSPVLLVELHPAAETLRVVLQRDNNIVVSAQTSSVGPGYHIYVCDLLSRMSRRFDVRWNPSSDVEGDETGYFESGDQKL